MPLTPAAIAAGRKLAECLFINRTEKLVTMKSPDVMHEAHLNMDNGFEWQEAC